MRFFILRARKGPTSPGMVRKTMGYPDHFEVIVQSLINAVLISRDTRHNVVFHVVLEGNPVPPLTISFVSSELGPLGGFDEESIAALFERLLERARDLQKGERIRVDRGIYLHKISFEALVRDLSDRMPLYLLDKKGESIRETEFTEDKGFLLTDHIPMQKKTLNLLKRLGVRGISLGPRMLFASQCVTIINYELDYREGSWV